MNYENFYRAFREISEKVHSSTKVQEVFQIVVKKVTEALNSKGTVLRFHNEENDELELAAAYGLNQRYIAKGPVYASKILAEKIELNTVTLIKDLWNAPRCQYPQEAWDEGIRMMLDVPLSINGKLVGLLRVFLGEFRDFSDDEIDFLTSIARQCACAIQNAQLVEAQQAQYQHLALQTEKLSALGRMAAGIAHEINNPLAGILLFSTNIVKKAPEGPIKEGLDIIIRETVRCKAIIQELLEFSRDKQPQKIITNINRVIEKALSILDNEFRLNQITLNIDLSENVNDCSIDENQIQQVIVNLLLNSIQSIEKNGRIQVRSRQESGKGEIEVEIEDNGCGIPVETIPRIFDPFFSTKSRGTGLGLAVSYGIIKNHQGDIKVESSLEKGTVMKIIFPAFINDCMARAE